MVLETKVLTPAEVVLPRFVPGLPVQEQVWPEQGEWTYEDYKRLPEDGRRYEIVEGVLHVTAAPNFDHQYTVMQLVTCLDRFVKDRHLGMILVAPFEVYLSDAAPVVQPDVLFIASERVPEPGAAGFSGAPDLVVEVLSPSTARNDRVVKFTAYEQAGVREYWLADPRTRSVEVYGLSDGEMYELWGQYTVEEELSSGLLEGLSLPVKELFVPL